MNVPARLTYADKLGEKKHQPDNEEAALQAHRVEDQQAEAHTGHGCECNFLQDLEHEVGHGAVQTIALLPNKNGTLQNNGLQT